MSESDARAILLAAKAWAEAQPLSTLLPLERAKAALARVTSEEALAKEVIPRLERGFDLGLERLRGEPRSLSEILGPAATERLVEAAGDLEPDERLVRGFFEERAVGDLLGSLIYDGIIEFTRKANQAAESLPGVSTAKKLAGGVGGLLGSLGGGLAGAVAGGIREEIERRLEQQAKSFLVGFGQAAIEKSVRFAMAPGNRAMFRDMRKNLVRKGLRAPLKDLAARLSPVQVSDARRKLVDGAQALAREERTTHRLEGRLEAALAAHGAKTLTSLAQEHGLPLPPAEPATTLLAPVLAAFLATEEGRRPVGAALADAAPREATTSP